MMYSNIGLSFRETVPLMLLSQASSRCLYMFLIGIGIQRFLFVFLDELGETLVPLLQVGQGLFQNSTPDNFVSTSRGK